MADLTLPAFELDCRDWLVLGPPETGSPEPDAADETDAPVLAVLSTAVIDVDITEATGVLTVGLLDDAELVDLPACRVAPGAAALELLDSNVDPVSRRYVMPAPGEHRLAILAEFAVPHGEAGELELDRRVQALMASFRWQEV